MESGTGRQPCERRKKDATERAEMGGGVVMVAVQMDIRGKDNGTAARKEVSTPYTAHVRIGITKTKYQLA